MGKNWTIGDNEGDDAYFYYFRAMENFPKKLFKLSTALKIEEEERNDVYIYKTLRYPPKSKQPEKD